MRNQQSGVALIMVIFIIVGLAVIAAPLAYVMLTHEQESAQLIENSRSSMAVFGARNHAIDRLAKLMAQDENDSYSHIPLDFEINDLGPGESTTGTGIKDTIDTFNSLLREKTAWGASAVDVQSKININTLTPQMCRNIIGRGYSDLYNYRINGDDEEDYRLFRTIFEARRLSITHAEMDALQECTTVWSGPNVYGHYFSREIPASIDEQQNINVHIPGVQNMIVPGTVIRIQTGEAGNYTRYFRRLTTINGYSDQTFNVNWNKPLEPAEECTIRIEIPRPVNVNTAPKRVLKALFTGLGLSLGTQVDTLSEDDVDKLVNKIMQLRDEAEEFARGDSEEENEAIIEGYNEMARIIVDLFGEGSVQSSILLRSITWPAKNLYQLNGYTAPLCYSSDNVFEISSFASLGAETYREKSRDDLLSIVSVCPLGEIAWSFSSQFAWQRVLDCGFGPYHVSGENPCFVDAPNGYMVDVNPNKKFEEGFISLKTEQVERDDYTTFIAHFDSGTKESVFDADYGTRGEKECSTNGLELLEEPDQTGLDSNGLNFQNGGYLSYACKDNIAWQKNDSNTVLQIMLPIEVEFWLTLPDDWDKSIESVFMEWGGSSDNENRITIGWDPSYKGGALDLAVCDAGLEEKSAHYKVPLPDENNYIQWEAGNSYHIRAVIVKSFNGRMLLMVDGKKLPGFFCDQDGTHIEDGYSANIADYSWRRPPTSAGGLENNITVDGTLKPGSDTLTEGLHKPRTSVDEKDDLGFTAFPKKYELANGEASIYSATDTEISVADSVMDFPESGVLIVRNGTTEYEFIYYKERTDDPHPTFKGCTRGYTISFDDGESCASASKGLELTALTPDDQGTPTPLNLISAMASGVEDYPTAGYLWTTNSSGAVEVIAYMGKGTNGALGGAVFYLDPWQGRFGRGVLGTSPDTIAPGSTLLQMFPIGTTAATADSNITVIKNDQTKEYMTIKHHSSGWIGLSSPVSATYPGPRADSTAKSRVLKFPSGELPTVRPNDFFVGAGRYGSREFFGSIDEIRIIQKTEGESGNSTHQPFDLYYGRKAADGDDAHLILANIWQVIEDGVVDATFTGECFVTMENQEATTPWNETIFMIPSEDAPDPTTVPPVDVQLVQGSNDFSSSVKTTGSTENFPQSGYILIQGTYMGTVRDYFTGAITQATRSYRGIFYYDGNNGSGFSTQSTTFTSNTSITVANLVGSTIKVALISTQVEFAQRGALWTDKYEPDDPSFAFPEGSRMLCLRYPYGVILDESLDSSDDASFILKSFELEADEETIFHFELGKSDENNLEVIGASLDIEEDDGLHFIPHFRACFGTSSFNFSENTVATMIPVRYKDCSKKRSDSLNLRYLALQNQLPGMRIKGLEWLEEENSPDETQIRILMRVDASCDWDTEPGDDAFSLREWVSPCDERIDISCDDFEFFPGSIVEFRIFFEWKTDAYLSNTWKKCIKLKTFRMFYERSTQILSSRKSVY